MYYNIAIIRINFDFVEIVRKNVCGTNFLAYKIYNSAINSTIFFRTKTLIIPSILKYLIRKGSESIKVLYEMS